MQHVGRMKRVHNMAEAVNITRVVPGPGSSPIQLACVGSGASDACGACSDGHSPAASLSRRALDPRQSVGAASLNARSEVLPNARTAAAAVARDAQAAEWQRRGTAADAAPRARPVDPRQLAGEGQGGAALQRAREAYACTLLGVGGLNEVGYSGGSMLQRRGLAQGSDPGPNPGRSGGAAPPPQLSAGGSQAPGEVGPGGPAAAPGASGRSREGMLTRPLARVGAGAASGEAAAAGGGGGGGVGRSAGRRGTSGQWQEGAGVALADTATSAARLACEGFDQSQ